MDDIYISKYKNQNFSSNDLPHGSPAPKRPSGERPRKPEPPKKKKKSVFKRIFCFFLVVAIMLGAIYGVVFSFMAQVNYNSTGHRENVYVSSDELVSSIGVTNILLIGVDARSGETVSRSDTMMMLSIDKTHGKIKLTSFLRDTWVYIPDNGYAKLNAACTYGGAQLVMDTIEYNYNVRIDCYMLVDFEVFKTIVNDLGGVSVDITEKEAKYMRNTVHLTSVQAGDDILLNGNEALWYCRIRYLDNDLMRTKRQRKVISSIIAKAKRAGVAELVGIVNDVLPQIETDMSPFKLTNLSMGAAALYLSYEVESQQIPADGTWSDGTKKGQSVLVADISENQEILSDFLYTKGTEQDESDN